VAPPRSAGRRTRPSNALSNALKPGASAPAPKERTRNCGLVADLVAQRVKKSSGRITAKRLLPAARNTGYTGSAQVVLADRMGCLKGGVVANRVVPKGDYVRFALHYRFRPDFCEAADPEPKGIVQNLVGYAKSDLLTPLLLEQVDLARATRRPGSGVRRSGRSSTLRLPPSRPGQERPLLGALPSLQLRIGPAPVLRTVDKLS